MTEQARGDFIDGLVRERRGPIEVLRIDRPEARNALNGSVMAGLANGLYEADRDPEVRAVVITATGDRAFCSGMDLRDFAAGTTASAEIERGRERYRTFIRSGVETPVIGAANGTAVAGGFELLLACDMTVAAETAKFGLPEVKRGLMATGGGMFLGRRIPPAVAYELTLTGELIDSERALALGLVNRVVPPDEVLDAAIDLAEQIAGNGPIAVRTTKHLVRQSMVLTPEELWDEQDRVRDQVFGSDDAKEGARAFVERRDPVWTGR